MPREQSVSSSPESHRGVVSFPRKTRSRQSACRVPSGASSIQEKRGHGHAQRLSHVFSLQTQYME